MLQPSAACSVCKSLGDEESIPPRRFAAPEEVSILVGTPSRGRHAHGSAVAVQGQVQACDK